MRCQSRVEKCLLMSPPLPPPMNVGGVYPPTFMDPTKIPPTFRDPTKIPPTFMGGAGGGPTAPSPSP